MAKVSGNNITNLNEDWGLDQNTNLPFSGQAVQTFIKSFLRNVTAAAWFDPTNYTMYFFGSAEDRDAFIADTSLTTLITFSCPMNFSSTMYRVNITNNTGQTIINTATNSGTLPLSATFYVQTKSISDTEWSDTQTGAYVTIGIDRGVTGIYTPLTERILYPAGSTISMDVFSELVVGMNRVRFMFEAEDGSVTQSLVYTINLAELYVELFNNTWYTPIIEGNTDTYSLGGFRIAGAGSKTLNISIFDEEGTQVVPTIEQLIGTTNAYASTPYFYRFDQTSAIFNLTTGIYTVKVNVSTDTLTSEEVEYHIMYVAQEDTNTAQLVCVNEVPEQVYNYSTSLICRYAAYNGGLTTADLTVTFFRKTGDTIVDSETFQLAGVQTGGSQPLNYAAEWDVTGDGHSIAFTVTQGSSTDGAEVPLDNSTVFPPTQGYDFYLNAATRSNSDTNKTIITNGDEELAATWSNIDFIDGVDGWTTDDNGRKCLRIPAGCSFELPASSKQLLSNDNITLELCYKVANVADYDENVITIATNPTQPGFQGIRIRPTNITVHSAADTSAQNDTKRGSNLSDEEIIHFALTINPYFEGTNKLVKGYYNGNKNFEFSYAASSEWPTNASLIIAPQKSDVFLYFVRRYTTALADPMVQTNYVSSLTTVAERNQTNESFLSVVDAGQTNIDFETVKNNGYNFFIVHMEDNGGVPSAANGWGKNTTKKSVLEMHYGLHPEWDWKIENVETGGQGTTSMNYYRWNIRWRIDKSNDAKKCPVSYVSQRTKVGQSYQYTWTTQTDSKTVKFDGDNHPAVKRITAKINQASSMQSHKMGATLAYTALHDALGLRNEAQTIADNNDTPRPTVAVYEYPAFGFEYNSLYGTYTFVGLFTIGPDKGDKPTFGFDTVAETLISMEGTDHSQPLAKFAYPWNSQVKFLASEEGLTIVKGTGSYETGLEVGNCHDLSTDKAADQDAVEQTLIAEFKGAYDLAWNNSTLIFGIALGTYASTAAATLTYINNNLEAFRKTMYNSRLSYADMQFWIDGEYILYYYDVVNERYVAGQTLGTPTGSTIDEKNEYFKAQRRAAFKASAENYWDIQDCLYHFDFVILFGATDNFAKNTYPYKMAALANGGRWKWRQDDLDSLFDIDNSGSDTKPYYIEFLDAMNGSPFYAGSASTFWNLIFECYWDDYVSTVTGAVTRGLQTMGKNILEAMRDLSGASNVYDGFVSHVRQLFWTNAQEYFPKSAYNVDANFKYEQAWIAQGQEVDPLSQSLGNHYSAEVLWVKRRAVYMMSLFKAGPFGDYSDSTLGTVSFRPAGLSTTLSPAFYMYPALLVGQSTVNTGSRTAPGGSQSFSAVGDGNTMFYIQASNYLANLGDLKALTLGAGYVNPLLITAAKVVGFKIGDDTASSVTTNVPGLTFANTRCLEVINAKNASSIGAVNIASCSRLRELYLEGTNVTSADIPRGSKITNLSLPATIQRIDFQDLRHLDDEDLYIEDYANIRSLRIEHTKADALTILKQTLPMASNLSGIRLIWDGMSYDSDGSIISALTVLATGDYKGLDASGAEIPNPVIEGNVNVQVGIYQQDVDVIEEAFPQLTMHYPMIYIRFEDPAVEAIAVAQWGDGTGLTAEQAAAVTNIARYFENNTTITSFDELAYFTGLTYIYGNNVNNAAFYGATQLRHVKLPSSVTNIQVYAFRGCTSLESVDFPSGLTTLGGYAFYGCTSFSEDINLPNLTSIGENVFNGCTSLRRIVDLGKLTSITGTNTQWGVFRGCTSLEEVNFPNTLVNIGQSAFYGCTSLTRIDLPSSIRSIAGMAFYNLNIPITGVETLTSIGDLSFAGSFTGMQEVYFRDLSYIGARALLNTGNTKFRFGRSMTYFYAANQGTQGICSSSLSTKYLEEVVFEGNVTAIGPCAFYAQTALTTINLPTSIVTLAGSCFYNTGFTNIIYLPNLTYLGASAFNYSKITKVTSIGSITTIPDYAFANTQNLTEITIPDTVTSIDQYFIRTSACSKLILLGTTPPALSGNGLYDNHLTEILVPSSGVYTYSIATNWRAQVGKIYPATGNDVNAVLDGVWLRRASNTNYIEAASDYSITFMIPVDGYHQLTFNAGFVYNGTTGSGCLMTFNSANNYINYYDMTTNPRTITFNNASVTGVRMTVKTSELANCYIYDETAGEYLWKGSDVTTHYTEGGVS